jgi:hypothetical protein
VGEKAQRPRTQGPRSAKGFISEAARPANRGGEPKARSASRLSNEIVHGLVGAVMVWDGDPKATGFGVRSYSGGSKSFFIDYRMDGVQRRFTIGPFPRWSVTAARERARELRKQIDRGIDPPA